MVIPLYRFPHSRPAVEWAARLICKPFNGSAGVTTPNSLRLLAGKHRLGQEHITRKDIRMQPDPATETKERRRTCIDHCAGCGQHFHGLGAFDAHRKGGYCHDPLEVLYGPDSKRSGQPVLQAWTTDGYCDKERGCWIDGKRDHYVEGVTIWQIASTPEQAAALLKLGQRVLF
jgi:hypothetical protein